MPAHDVDKGGIALGGPDGGKMADQPDRCAGNPEAAIPSPTAAASVPFTIATARGAPPSKDRLGQRAMDGRIEPGDRFGVIHQIKRSAAELEERQEERAGGEGDAESEDDLDQPPKAAGRFAERERQAR